MLEALFLVLNLTMDDFYTQTSLKSTMVQAMVKSPSPNGIQLDAPPELDRKKKLTLPSFVSMKHSNEINRDLPLSKYAYVVVQSGNSGEFVIDLPFEIPGKMPMAERGKKPAGKTPVPHEDDVETSFDATWFDVENEAILQYNGAVFSHIIWGELESNAGTTAVFNGVDYPVPPKAKAFIPEWLGTAQHALSPEMPKETGFTINQADIKNFNLYGSFTLPALDTYPIVKRGYLPICVTIHGEDFKEPQIIKAWVPVETAQKTGTGLSGYFNFSIETLVKHFVPDLKAVSDENYISVFCLGNYLPLEKLVIR